MQWLDQHDVQYEPVNVIEDEAAFDEMIRLSGQELVPVLLEVLGQGVHGVVSGGDV